MSNLLMRKEKTTKNLKLYFLIVIFPKNVFKMFGIVEVLLKFLNKLRSNIDLRRQRKKQYHKSEKQDKTSKIYIVWIQDLNPTSTDQDHL